ncbi:MAG: DUF2442 domain-containing protein [Bacteroidia bacterium]|jgi:hypothetical protein|nr:DUF2442 domain-containing protein [Bacteroidia bacterium]
MNKAKQVVVLDHYQLDLTFTDGTHGVVDLSSLAGRGVFAAWKDYALFRRVAIGKDGDLVWPGGVDLCPDSLYLKLTGKNPDEAFPNLNNELAHA